MGATNEKSLGGNAGSGTPSLAGPPLRIEPIDNWHSAWPLVLRFVEQHGDARALHIDGDGWLSARQVLLVAFVGDQVAAYVCFSVAPGKTCIEATLDDYALAPKFAGRRIESALNHAAMARAESLGCEKLKGFAAKSKRSRPAR